MTVKMPSGDVFETGCDMLEVTRRHRPDTNWHMVDKHSHEHRWHVAGVPAPSYSPSANYDTPTLINVHDGWGYWEDGERYAINHFECRQCGEHVEPGYTADTERQYVPGLRWCRINGGSVTPEEFKRRYAAGG